MDIDKKTNTVGNGLFLAAGLLLLSVMAAQAAPTAAEKCEAGKVDAAGKHAACLAKAEKGAVFNGADAKYDAAVAKCQEKLADAFAKLEAAAGKQDAECPSVDDAGPVEVYVAECVDGMAAAMAGGELPTCDGGGGGGVLLQTGQTTAYGAGSDGDLGLGAARSFTDNGDGTITDNATGLMWEKKSDDDSIHDQDNTYTWGEDSPPYSMNGAIVTTFLADLNGGGGFAGYTDWRIPNIHELHSLVNFEEPYPGPTAFPAFNDSCTGGCTVTTCSCTRSNYHWSSSTYRDGEEQAWYVRFGDGGTSYDDKTDTYGVRAVRGGS